VLAIPRQLTTILAAFMLAACGGGAAATPTTAPVTPAPVTASPTAEATLAPTRAAGLTLVAIGDSIPYNSPDDCPECIGFVDQYGTSLEAASGQTVTVRNNSEHNSNTVDLLLAGLTNQQNRIDAVAGGDAIIVGIAHNDAPMNRDDDGCDGAGGENPDWSKFTDECLAAEVAEFTPKYEALYARVAELQAGKPTILRTINRYNDWNGWPGHDLSADGVATSVKIIDLWNEMICAAAEKSGFVCADISTVFNGEDGTTPSGDLVAGDYTHPSQKGNDAIAKALIDLGFAPLAP
jgi:lysophospholipase L1-like esterase